MLRATVLAACVVASLGATAGSWNYNRCDHLNGPMHWANACGKGEQSPIDVCGAETHDAVTMSTLEFSSKYNEVQDFTFSSDGKAYLDASGLGMSMTAGKLSHVTRPSVNPDETVQWNLAQAHFHWGRNPDDGSEHYLEGRQYPLEIHFVHVNNKYENISVALESGNSDALLVVGQVFDVGAATGESEALKDMASRMPHATTTEGVKTPMRAWDLLDASAGFYTYPGSLTTPTCDPVVTWVVLASVKTITAETLAKFHAITKADQTHVSKYGNYRPLMPHGGRKIYRTPNVMTLPCMKAREPHFDCSVHEKAEKQEEIVKLLEQVTAEEKPPELQPGILSVVAASALAALIAAGKAILLD